MAHHSLGQYLTLTDFCTCSHTYQEISSASGGEGDRPINPWPQQPESIEALAALAAHLIDPIIDHYGRERFVMTYGFCSRDLKRYLSQRDPTTGRKRGRIDPSRDQHMALERNRNGRLYCPRQGAACDFYIHGRAADQVVRWILNQSLPFDSIYYYGAMRPLHISHGPEHKQSLWTFTQQGMPRPWQPER